MFETLVLVIVRLGNQMNNQEPVQKGGLVPQCYIYIYVLCKVAIINGYLWINTCHFCLALNKQCIYTYIYGYIHSYIWWATISTHPPYGT